MALGAISERRRHAGRGSSGQASSAAANAALDAHARCWKAMGEPVVAVQWGPWSQGGSSCMETWRSSDAVWACLIHLFFQDGPTYQPPFTLLNMRLWDLRSLRC